MNESRRGFMLGGMVAIVAGAIRGVCQQVGRACAATSTTPNSFSGIGPAPQLFVPVSGYVALQSAKTGELVTVIHLGKRPTDAALARFIKPHAAGVDRPNAILTLRAGEDVNRGEYVVTDPDGNVWSVSPRTLIRTGQLPK